MAQRASRFSLILVVLLLTSCGGGGGDLSGGGSNGGSPLSVDTAYVAYLNQLVDPDDNAPAGAVTNDLFVGLVELYIGRAYDTDPDNDDVKPLSLSSSPESVTFVAFAAGDTNKTLAEGHASLSNGELYLTIAMGDITASPPDLAAPVIRTYPIEPDPRILANDRVRFRVIDALASPPILTNVTLPGDNHIDQLEMGEATDYYLELPVGSSLIVSLDGTRISCPVEPGGNYEVIIANRDFDIADSHSNDPTLFCHSYGRSSTSFLRF